MDQTWVIVLIVCGMAILIIVGIRVVQVTGKFIFGEDILRIPMPSVRLFNLKKKKNEEEEAQDGNGV